MFAADVDVITYEFENVPAATAMVLAARKPVLPAHKILETTQDRLIEKDFVTRLGIGTADYADVSSVGKFCARRSRRSAFPPSSRPAASAMTARARPSSATATISSRSGRSSAPSPRSSKPSCRSSARFPSIAARSADGDVECFDVTENEHRDHILKISRAPADIPDALAAEARAVAEKIATALDYVGVLAVEMFVVQDKDGAKVLVNEIAPRVHNSGHWTLDGATISQFEQHIRAIAGWPLGKPVRHGHGHHDQPDRRRHQRLPAMAVGSRRHRPSLRQGRAAPGPENGACDRGPPDAVKKAVIGAKNLDFQACRRLPQVDISIVV